jgi:hypothetical protein
MIHCRISLAHQLTHLFAVARLCVLVLVPYLCGRIWGDLDKSRIGDFVIVVIEGAQLIVSSSEHKRRRKSF